MENPHTAAKLSPKFFFISLGVFVTLVTSVVSLLSLLFATLDKHFPDALNAVYNYGYNTYDYSAMRASLATLIIFFPLFIVLSSFWVKLIEKNMSHADAIVKKWMLYLIIFFASLVAVIDLVTLVNYFVSGEITTRFIYKVLSVLVVAAIGIFYYFRELNSETMKKSIRVASSVAATVIVLGAIIASFLVMGSPFTQRTLRLDDRRVQDLQSIQSQVITYWQQKQKLPAALSDLSNPLTNYSLPVDPEFDQGKIYEYKPTGNLSFDLCATFSLPMPKGWQEYSNGSVVPMGVPGSDAGTTSAVAPYPGSGMNDSWDHQGGRTCFSRTIDRDIYPPFTKPNAQ